MPPLAVPSSLVSTMPVTSTTSVNTRACTTAVLPGGGVEDEQHLVDRPVLLHHPLDLAELVHEPGLGVQPAGGVDEDRVHAPRPCRCLTASKATLAGSPPSGPRTVAAPTRVAPGLQLVGGGGAEGVGGAEQDAAPVGDEDPGELAAGRGLAGAVDARRRAPPRAGRRACAVRRLRSVVGADLGEQLVAQQRCAARPGCGRRAPGPGCAARSTSSWVGRHAHVGGEQGVLDLLPGRPRRGGRGRAA